MCTPFDESEPARIKKAARWRYGFLQEHEIAALAKHDESRLWPVLVRCNQCRFTCPVQDAQHLIDIIEADHRDYVRDVALVSCSL